MNRLRNILNDFKDYIYDSSINYKDRAFMLFSATFSYAGYVSMTICFMTIVSALISPRLISCFHAKWIVIVSIGLTIFGLLAYRKLKDRRL